MVGNKCDLSLIRNGGEFLVEFGLCTGWASFEPGELINVCLLSELCLCRLMSECTNVDCCYLYRTQSGATEDTVRCPTPQPAIL